MVPAPFEWDDVGDFASLASLLPARATGDRARARRRRRRHRVDAGGCGRARGGRRVAVVGLDDVVVVDTPDALLVTTRARAQDVKAVVDALKAQGRTDLT